LRQTNNPINTTAIILPKPFKGLFDSNATINPRGTPNTATIPNAQHRKGLFVHLCLITPNPHVRLRKGLFMFLSFSSLDLKAGYELFQARNNQHSTALVN